MDENSTLMQEELLSSSDAAESMVEEAPAPAPEPMTAPILLQITSRELQGGFIDSITSEPAGENGIVPKASAIAVGNRNPNLRTRRNVFLAFAGRDRLQVNAFAEKNAALMPDRDPSAISYLVNFLIHNRMAAPAESDFLTRMYSAVEPQDGSGFLSAEDGEGAWVRDAALAGDGGHISWVVEVFAPALTPEQAAARLRQKLDGLWATVDILSLEEEPGDEE